jgi:hypothetical protein
MENREEGTTVELPELRIGTVSTVVVMLIVIYFIMEVFPALTSTGAVFWGGVVLLWSTVLFVPGMYIIKLIGMYHQDVSGAKPRRRAAPVKRLPPMKDEV